MIIEKFDEKYYKYISDLQLSQQQLSQVQIHTYEYKEYVIHEDDAINALKIIISGNAKVTISANNGKILLLSFYKSFGVIGDVEFLSGEDATCNVIALSELKLISIPYAILSENLKQIDKQMHFLFRDLSYKLRNSSKQAVINNLYTLSNRVCGYIYSTNYKNYFDENLTETSELLGTSYRHLLRVIKELCDKKVLERVDKGIYKILDLDKLDELSDGCYR